MGAAGAGLLPDAGIVIRDRVDPRAPRDPTAIPSIGELLGKTLNAVLWYVHTGAPWRDHPQRYGSFQTAARYFRLWVDGGQLSRS